MSEELASYVTNKDPREGKLPAWARTTLDALRRDVRFLDAENTRLRAELALHNGEGPADSDTFVELESSALRLGRGTSVDDQGSAAARQGVLNG